MTKKRKCLAIILSLLTVFLIAVIFLHSAKTGNESVRDSDKFLLIPDSIMSLFGVEASRDLSSYIVRKTAHFLEYFALSLLISSLIYTLTDDPKRIGFALPNSLFISIIDEFVIQASTFGRSPEFKDVLIDFVGAITACALLTLVIRSKTKRSKK